MDSSHDLGDLTHRGSRLFRNEHGMEAIEFALIGALMTVLLVAALPLLGDGIHSVFETVMSVINGVEAGL
jgi:Flp pilus assembly pilin Flp